MSTEINIEEIMQEIRENIKQRGYEQEILSFDDVKLSPSAIKPTSGFSADDLIQEVDYMNRNWCNAYAVPISSKNPVAVLIKKVMQKLTNFIVFPIVNFQNEYNASNVRCVNQMKEYIAEMEEYKAKIEKLEKELKQVKAQLEAKK